MNLYLDQILLRGSELQEAAEQEDSPEVFAVAGFLFEWGLITAPSTQQPVPFFGFGRWLELVRRQHNMTLMDVSERTGAELLELAQIESGQTGQIQPRTVHQLAQLFSVDPRRLAVISGLVKDQPGNPLMNAAVKFAAQSESMEKLSEAERHALADFVQLLASNPSSPAAGKQVP